MERLNIKAARVNVHLTQEQLAKEMGVHRNTISSWESNPKTMTIEQAERISKILKLPINKIFFG